MLKQELKIENEDLREQFLELFVKKSLVETCFDSEHDLLSNIIEFRFIGKEDFLKIYSKGQNILHLISKSPHQHMLLLHEKYLSPEEITSLANQTDDLGNLPLVYAIEHISRGAIKYLKRLTNFDNFYNEQNKIYL